MDRSLDELMWLIADEGDDAAAEAFMKRHPEHRMELLKRIQAVRGMRANKPGELRPASDSRPRFSPRESTAPYIEPKPVRPWLVPALAMGLLAVGFASFTLTQSLIARNGSAPAVVATDAPSQAGGGGSGQPNEGAIPPLPQSNSAPTAPPVTAAPISLYDRMVEIESEGMDLFLVFNEISRQSGLKIEMGPGFENQSVGISYRGMTAIQVLRDLGHRHGFTVFEQTSTHVLLIPAVDPNIPVESSSDEAPPGPGAPDEMPNQGQVPGNEGVGSGEAGGIQPDAIPAEGSTTP